MEHDQKNATAQPDHDAFEDFGGDLGPEPLGAQEAQGALSTAAARKPDHLDELYLNAELSARGLQRIVLPTLFREEYLDSLRAFSREGETAPIIKSMSHIQRWSAAFNYDNLESVITLMAKCNAMEKSLIEHRLLMPQDLDQESRYAAHTIMQPAADDDTVQLFTRRMRD